MKKLDFVIVSFMIFNQSISPSFFNAKKEELTPWQKYKNKLNSKSSYFLLGNATMLAITLCLYNLLKKTTTIDYGQDKAPAARTQSSSTVAIPRPEIKIEKLESLVAQLKKELSTMQQEKVKLEQSLQEKNFEIQTTHGRISKLRKILKIKRLQEQRLIAKIDELEVFIQKKNKDDKKFINRFATTFYTCNSRIILPHATLKMNTNHATALQNALAGSFKTINGTSKFVKKQIMNNFIIIFGRDPYLEILKKNSRQIERRDNKNCSMSIVE